MSLRNVLAHRHIRGNGIEIGGLHNPLEVPKGTGVCYVDRMSLDDLNKTSDVKPIQNKIIVDDAETLATVGDGSQDFVIANHVLEHCHDPIGTMKNWLRVLKPGGVIYCALPDKDYTFDKDRMVTSMEHIMQDHDDIGHRMFGDFEHYRDWHYWVDKLRGNVLKERVQLDVSLRANIHFHVFDLPLMDEFFSYFKPMAEILERGVNQAEVVWVLRKV